MDEPPIKDDPEAEEPQAPAEVEEAPQSKTQAPTEEVVFEGLATGKEPWRGGGGCSSRLPLYGCLFGMALLIGKAQRAVVQSLPRNLPAAERQRTIENLERFRALLESSKDPYPEMGEFVNRVRAVLKDGRFTAEEVGGGRFTAEEVGGLNVFIERMIEESGISSQQLGERIRNSEIGIRNAAHPTDPSARAVPALGRDDILDELPGSTGPPVLGRAAGNSEFRIPNSEFV